MKKLILLVSSFFIINSQLNSQNNTVRGSVWVESIDFDGYYNEGELLQAAIDVSLYSSTQFEQLDNLVASTTITPSSLFYEFTDLPNGDYTVVIDASNFLPAATLFGFSISDIYYSAANFVDNDNNGHNFEYEVITDQFTLSGNETNDVDFGFTYPCENESQYFATDCNEVIPFCDFSLLNGFCARMSSIVTGNGPSPLCSNGGVPHNISWMAFIAPVGNYEIDIYTYMCNGAGIQFGIYDSCDWDNEIWCDGSCGPSSNNISLSSDLFTPGQIYYAFFDGCSGTVCNIEFSIEGSYQPSVGVPTEICSTIDNNLDCNDQVSCEINTSIDFEAQGVNLESTFMWNLTDLSNPSKHESFEANGAFNFLFQYLGKFELCISPLSTECISSSETQKCIVINVLPSKGTLGGTVWIEDNSNSQLDASDLGVSNTLVELWQDIDHDGNLDFKAYGPVKSDNTGFFYFTDVDTGHYAAVLSTINFDMSNSLVGTIPTDDYENYILTQYPNIDNALYLENGVYKTPIFDYNEENKNTIDNSNQIMLGLQFDCKHSTALSANTCVLADKMPFCSLSKLDKYCFPTNLDGNNLNNDGQCNSIGLSNDAHWISFVAGYGNYSIQLIPANCKDDAVDFGTLRYALYGDCDLSDLVDCNTTCQPNEHFFIYSSNLTPGHRYFLAIESCESNSCQVSIKTQGVFTDYSADCKNTLEGTIYYDQDSDCNLSTNDQNALEGILVKANNGSKTYYTTTDINGYYQFNLPDGIYSLSVYTSGKTIDVCNTQDINDVNLGNVTEPINILLNQQIDCQELEVYINPGALRRCFNSLATIKITNDSDLLIEHATLYLDKSDKINISSANYPYTVQANGSLLFQNLIIYPKSKKNIIVNYSV
ncbi:MAG: hypothetical protein KDC16_12390, partial [Saprospiraceae bacterium]|nr:hypothetical protein [Saprospiraceae bacterium]